MSPDTHPPYGHALGMIVIGDDGVVIDEGVDVVEQSDGNLVVYRGGIPQIIQVGDTFDWHGQTLDIHALVLKANKTGKPAPLPKR